MNRQGFGSKYPFGRFTDVNSEELGTNFYPMVRLSSGSVARLNSKPNWEPKKKNNVDKEAKNQNKIKDFFAGFQFEGEYF